MKFQVGDLVECIESISIEYNGPKAGEYYIVTVSDRHHIGFKIPAYNWGNDSLNETIRLGLRTNWGVNCFKLVVRNISPTTAEVLYGIKP